MCVCTLPEVNLGALQALCTFILDSESPMEPEAHHLASLAGQEALERSLSLPLQLWDNRHPATALVYTGSGAGTGCPAKAAITLLTELAHQPRCIQIIKST